MIKNSNRLVKSFFIVFVLIVIAAICDKQTAARNFTFVPLLTIPEDQLWSDEYAQQIAKESIDLSVGAIIDIDKFKLLWQQADNGDKNALFYQLRMKIVTDIFYSKYEKNMFEHEERILEFYQPETTFSPLSGTGYKSNSDQHIKTILLLADLKHSLSSKYVYECAISTNAWFDKLGKTDEQKQDKLVQYLDNAIQGGYHFQQEWAEYTLFSLDKSWDKPLSEYNRKVSPEKLTELIENGYKIAAYNGSLPAANRVAEAYFYGIGVEKDNKQAYIWSKVTETVYPIFYEQAIEEQDAEFESAMTHFLKQSKEIQKSISPHIDATQRIASQKEIDNLVNQIQFHYIDWKDARDPIASMP